MKKGQRVYGEHGEEAVYAGAVDGKHVVCPIVYETNYEGDGSGNWTTFVPCESEDEANAIAMSEAEKLITGWDGKGWPHRAVEAAKVFGLQLPVEMQKLVVAAARDKLANAEKLAGEYESSAERARAALLAAEVALADAGNSQL